MRAEGGWSGADDGHLRSRLGRARQATPRELSQSDVDDSMCVIERQHADAVFPERAVASMSQNRIRSALELHPTRHARHGDPHDTPHCRPPFRRLVLGAAFAAALAIAGFAPHVRGSVRAIGAVRRSNAVARGGAADQATRRPPDARRGQGSRDAKRERRRSRASTSIDRGVVDPEGRQAACASRAWRADREYDSFEEFVDHAPWLAGLVFVVVTAGVPDPGARSSC